jgi:hypothetical protein
MHTTNADGRTSRMTAILPPTVEGETERLRRAVTADLLAYSWPRRRRVLLTEAKP